MGVYQSRLKLLFHIPIALKHFIAPMENFLVSYNYSYIINKYTNQILFDYTYFILNII
jgi:hypothetical protein